MYKLDRRGQIEWSKFLPQSIFGLAIADDSIVVADALGGKILYLDMSGEETSRFNVSLDISLTHLPLAFDGSSVWVPAGSKVRQYDSGGTTTAELPIDVGQEQPWAASSMVVWVLNEDLSTVVGFGNDGMKIAEFNPLEEMGLSDEEVLTMEWHDSSLWVHTNSASGRFDTSGRLQSQTPIAVPDPGNFARYRRLVSSEGIWVHESVGRQVRTSANRVMLFPFSGGQPIVIVSDLKTGWLFGNETGAYYATAQGSSVLELDPRFDGPGAN